MHDHVESKPSHSHESDKDVQGGGPMARIKRRWRAFSQASAAEIFSEMLARFFVGLLLGGIACVALIPIVFWPGRRTQRAIFNEISDTNWALWLFAGALLLPAIIGALSTLLGDPKAGFKAALGMKKRPARYEITDGVMLIEEAEPPTSWLRRILGAMGNTLAWIVVCAPGLIFMLAGFTAIINERIRTGRTLQRTAYGAEAIGLGWIEVALGVWFLAEGFHLKTDRPVYRWLGWLLAGACLAKGISVLISGK